VAWLHDQVRTRIRRNVVRLLDLDPARQRPLIELAEDLVEKLTAQR